MVRRTRLNRLRDHLRAEMLLTGTYMTDSMGLDFCKFTIGSLVACAASSAELGTPSLINHDYTRLVGWNDMSSVYFEPGITRVLGHSFVTDTKEERAELIKRFNHFINLSISRNFADGISRLKEILSDHLTGNEESPSLEAAVVVGDSLAKKVFPSLFEGESVDSDGLTSMNLLTPVGPGVFKMGELLVYAHPHFRRSSYRINTFNGPFLTSLQEVNLDGVSKRIKLDPDMVGLAETYDGPRMERSLWAHGAPFSDDIPSIKAGVHRLESTNDELFFSMVSRTECFWYQRGGFQNFEAEELKDSPNATISKGNYLCRYVHAMVPDGTSSPSHFDGAIRSYSAEEMVLRLDTDLMRTGRNTDYIKLWRLDGPIPIERWKVLFADYYLDNPHVGEYLSGQLSGVEKEESNLKTKEKKSTPSLLASLVPYSIKEATGLRVALSFRPRLLLEGKRILLHSYCFPMSDKVVPIVDSNGLDLAKAFWRKGQELKLPDQYVVSCPKDRYFSLPIIAHSGEDSFDAVRLTIENLRTALLARREKLGKFAVTLGLRFWVDEQDAVVSVAGEIDSVLSLISEQEFTPPTTAETLATWGERIGSWIARQGWEEGPPEMTSFLHNNGELLFDRVPVPDDQIKFSKEEKAIMYHITFKESDAELRSLIERGHIRPAMTMVYSDPMCAHCKISYSKCACCKWLDRDCATVIKDIVGMSAHWTDRPLD